ncbi:MAG: glycosyltransferase family 4 protein [bacterium]
MSDIEIGKVLMITGSFPPLPCGVGDSAHALAIALARHGVDLEILADSGADSVDAGSAPFPVHAEIDNWGLWHIKKIIREVEKISPSILHIHYPSKVYGRGLAIPFLPMVLRSRRRRMKILITLHEFRLAHPARKLASFILIESSDAVVTPCLLELIELKRRHVSVEEKINLAIPVGPIGPDPEDYSQEDRSKLRKKFREEWGVSDNEVVLIHFGTPTISKGLEILFKAMRLLKLEGETPLLVVVGDHNPEVNEFHRLLSSQPGGLGIRERVKWLGRVSTEDFPGVICASDIGVFPFLDGFSFRRSSLIGILVWDLPIVTTEPMGQLDDLIGQEKIRFCVRNDPKALATSLISLVANPKALAAAKAAPNPLKELFNWDTIAEEYIDIYRRIMA